MKNTVSNNVVPRFQYRHVKSTLAELAARIRKWFSYQKRKKKKKKKNPRTKDGGPIYPRVDLRATRKPQSLEAPTNFSVLLHVSNNLLFHVFTVRFESEHISRPKPFTNLRNVKNLINFSILSLTTMPGELLPKLSFIYKRKIATFPSSVVKCCTFHFHTRT